jgi:hypothetical protein
MVLPKQGKPQLWSISAGKMALPKMQVTAQNEEVGEPVFFWRLFGFFGGST